ncbi:hypothetical protein HYU90_03495 [Candidatus Collierbacteria bacterium]|nr:hypothetical protein [Candidatus Collierbacteria bacterium]
MTHLETIKKAYSLPPQIARDIAESMGPDETVMANISYKRLDWLRAMLREAGHLFLAATTTENTLNLYVLTEEGVGVLDYKLKSQDPLHDLWLEEVLSRFGNTSRRDYIIFFPHRPN